MENPIEIKIKRNGYGNYGVMLEIAVCGAVRYARYVVGSEEAALHTARLFLKQSLAEVEKQMDKKDLSEAISKDITGKDGTFAQPRITDLCKQMIAAMESAGYQHMKYFRAIPETLMNLISTERH